MIDYKKLDEDITNHLKIVSREELLDWLKTKQPIHFCTKEIKTDKKCLKQCGKCKVKQDKNDNIPKISREVYR